MLTEPRGNYWVQTATGGTFDFVNPTSLMISLDDLAFSLARICRFTGHLRPDCPPYSVAQHLVWCASRVRIEVRAYALLHDAHEAYIGDMSSPLKAMLRDRLGEDGYEQLANHLDAIIYPVFGLMWPIPPSIRTEVKAVDLLALATERRDLMQPTAAIWADKLPDPDPHQIVPLDWNHAAEIFREMMDQLHRSGHLTIPYHAARGA